MSTKYECYGGPLDGQELKPPAGLPAFGQPEFGSMLIHFDDISQPHLYQLAQHIDESTQEESAVLEYRGPAVLEAIRKIYTHDPEMGEALARDLEHIMTHNDAAQDFNSEIIVDWCQEKHDEKN